jgi:hypothetical protein
MYRLAVVWFRSHENCADGNGICISFSHLNETSQMLSMRIRSNVVLFVMIVCACASWGLPVLSWAVSCTTQSQMTETERSSLVEASKSLAGLIQAGNTDGLKARTIPSVAEHFDPIAAAVESAAPLIERGAITIESMYLLESTDLKSTEDNTQFFCGGANAHEVVFTIPQVPPGSYALAVLRATGVDSPQSITLILARDTPKATQWKLAGAFIHGLTSAGHDGVWYWNRAREFAKKGQKWNAYFYYQTAASLLTPVYFLSSPNLDKLLKEQAAIAPSGLPAGNQPMPLSGGGQNFSIQDMHTDSSLGGLDLVIHYQANDVSDPVAARTRNVALMTAMLAQHPELREGFHGLWAYANAPNQQPFANELAMDQIR